MWGEEVTKGLLIQMTGLSGSGKSTLAKLVSNSLKEDGYAVEILDGDEYRAALCSDLGFSKEDRNTNIKRLGFVGDVLARHGIIAIMATINPYEEIRLQLTQKYDNIVTVYIKCDIDTLLVRDPKGLYKKATLPDGHKDKIYNFTGISDPFEIPQDPDLTIETTTTNLNESVKELKQFIINTINDDN
tara:strand:+ start:3166 stop:3726 length:561 start_codon:yes stop_codon:yes gene_type:complete